MSPTLSRNSDIQCFERSDTKDQNTQWTNVMFFYPGLPYVYSCFNYVLLTVGNVIHNETHNGFAGSDSIKASELTQSSYAGKH